MHRSLQVQDWLADNLPEGARVGIDPFVHTIEAAEKLRKRLRAAGKSLVPLEVNPVDGVWKGRPAAPEVRASGSARGVVPVRVCCPGAQAAAVPDCGWPKQAAWCWWHAHRAWHAGRAMPSTGRCRGRPGLELASLCAAESGQQVPHDPPVMPTGQPFPA